MAAIVINSSESLQRAIGDLRDMWNRHHFLRLNVKTGKDRSLDFNALSHVWYEQLARELKEDDALGWKSFCKLQFAVPILRTEDEEFRQFYDNAIKHALTYEQKLAAMRYIPVSSLMTNTQFKKYCEAMQAHFLKFGVSLEFPVEK
jgi:hypothetical protein